MVVESHDAGETWKDLTSFAANDGWRGTGYSGMCGNRIAWNPYKPGQVFTLGDDEGKLERSEDYLWSWRLKGSPGLIGPYNGAADVTFAADGTIYVGSGQFGNHAGRYANEPIIKSSDGGGSWSYVKRPDGAVGDNRAVLREPERFRAIVVHHRRRLDGHTVEEQRRRHELDGPRPAGRGQPLEHRRRSEASHDDVRRGRGTGSTAATTAPISGMPGSPTSRNYEYAYLDPTDAGTVYAVSFNSDRSAGCIAATARLDKAPRQAAGVRGRGRPGQPAADCGVDPRLDRVRPDRGRRRLDQRGRRRHLVSVQRRPSHADGAGDRVQPGQERAVHRCHRRRRVLRDRLGRLAHPTAASREAWWVRSQRSISTTGTRVLTPRLPTAGRLRCGFEAGTVGKVSRDDARGRDLRGDLPRRLQGRRQVPHGV